jgi:hypothetical protein
MAQGDDKVLLSAGDITLIDASKPSDFTYSENSRQLSLILPYQLVEQTLRFNQVKCGHRIAGTSPIARLSHRLILDAAHQQNLSRQESEATLEAIVSLLRPAISQTDDCGGPARAHLPQDPELYRREHPLRRTVPGMAGAGSRHVDPWPVPDVCQERPGGGALHQEPTPGPVRRIPASVGQGAEVVGAGVFVGFFRFELLLHRVQITLRHCAGGVSQAVRVSRGSKDRSLRQLLHEQVILQELPKAAIFCFSDLLR